MLEDDLSFVADKSEADWQNRAKSALEEGCQIVAHMRKHGSHRPLSPPPSGRASRTVRKGATEAPRELPRGHPQWVRFQVNLSDV